MKYIAAVKIIHPSKVFEKGDTVTLPQIEIDKLIKSKSVEAIGLPKPTKMVAKAKENDKH